MAVQLAVLIDENGLARCHIVDHGESKDVQRDTLRRNHVLGALLALADADHQGPHALWVAETQYPVVHQ